MSYPNDPNNMRDYSGSGRYERNRSSAGWVIAALVVLAVIAAFAYGMRGDHQTASTGAPQTTGQSTPSTGAPPATPMQGAPATIR